MSVEVTLVKIPADTNNFSRTVLPPRFCLTNPKTLKAGKRHGEFLMPVRK